MGDKILLNIKKYKSVIVVVFVTILALVLRLISIDKPNGLWFDEIYCHHIASQSFPFGILDKLYNEDFHAPLYFMLLHFWMKVLGNSDIVLRLFSCLFGVLSIPAFYLLGKEMKSANFGILTASFVAVNSMLIYYSQEVKFYSLLFFLSSLFLLFLIRYSKSPSKLNFWALVSLNLAILYTYTMGCSYLLFINLCYLIYLCRKDMGNLKKLLLLYLIVAIMYLPYVPFIVHHFGLLSNYYISITEVFYLDIKSVLMTFQMWFTPLMYNLTNGVPVHLPPEYVYTLFFFSFAVFPSLICILGLIKTFQKRGLFSALLIMNTLFIFILLISASFGQFVFIPRYILIAMPALLLFSLFGLSELENKKLSKILISLYLVLNLYFIIFIPVSAPNLKRIEGYATAARMLESKNVGSNDIVSMPFAGEILTKYIDVNMLDLDFGKIYVRNKNALLEMILSKEQIAKLNKNNAREELSSYVFSSAIPPKLNEYLNKNVYSKLEKGDSFIVVVNTSYFLNLPRLTKNGYEKMPLLYVLYTKLVMHILDYSYKNLAFETAIKAQDEVWQVYVFKKK